MSKLVERLMPEAPDALPSFPELYPLLAELLLRCGCAAYRCGAVCCIMHIRYKVPVYGWDIQLRPTEEVDGFRQLLIMEIISTPSYLLILKSYLPT